MPWGLERNQQARCLHFITFSCHHRDPLLDPHARDVFLQILERVRQWYGFYVCGYVVMPEHVHLLISEPEPSKLSVALQMLKQNTARQLRLPEGSPFWQPRYYDFNVWTEDKRVEKLRYIHRNPVSLHGCPPRKRNDTSIGDAFNWEWMVHCATERKAGLVIVTRDSDYGIAIGKESYINDALRQEFSERVSQKRLLKLYSLLSDALKFFDVKVTEQEKASEADVVSRTPSTRDASAYRGALQSFWGESSPSEDQRLWKLRAHCETFWGHGLNPRLTRF